MSTAGMPRRRPSVHAMAMQRTVLLPRCCAASRVRLIWPIPSASVLITIAL